MKKEKKVSGLWLINTNSHYSNEEVWPLAMAALEVVKRGLRPGQEMRPIKIRFTNTEHNFCGRYLGSAHERIDRGYAAADFKKWFVILCRVGPPSRFAAPVSARYRDFKDMPEYLVHGHREAIIHIIAHEAEHAVGTPGGKQGETVCELVASDAVDYYRKHIAEIDGQIAGLQAAINKKQLLQAVKDSERRAAKNSKEVKIAKAQAMLDRWERRKRQAENKLKKYRRSLAQLQRVREPREEPALMLAAKGNP